MKALVLDRPGKPNSLRVDQVPIPQPGYGEIRVRVHAAGLNPVDCKVAASGHTNWTYPFVLGLDVAGVIDAVGEGVEDWKVSADDARKSMLTAGMPTEIVEAMLELYQINKLGYAAEVSHTIEEITGQKATSFETFANDYKEVFMR